MYWFNKFLSSSFWLWSSPVSEINFCLDWSKSWYFPRDLSRVFQIRNVLSGKTWVIFYQYFLPSLAIRSFFSLSDNCFKDFFVVFSSIFFLSSLVVIHWTRKSTSKTGSTLKSLFMSTLTTYSSTGGASTFSIFLSSPLCFFFLAFSSYSLASCSFFNFSS